MKLIVELQTSGAFISTIAVAFALLRAGVCLVDEAGWCNRRCTALPLCKVKGKATAPAREKTVDTINAVAGEACASKAKSARRASFTLEYDGSRYGVPAGLSDDQ